VQNVIKETASTKNVDFKQGKNFKVIIIHEADNLTKEAQAGLRRTMEKYMGNCRIIMTCTCLSKIIMPIRSRCLSLRVPSPTNDEIKRLLKDIKMKENVVITDKMIDIIVENSDRNVRKAINTLQISKKLINFFL
jgi:replication factor C subunit 3/5